MTLIVVGQDLDPEAVSNALGMEPDESWRRGERKSWRRPDGTVRQFESIHVDGGWKKSLPERYKVKPLYEQVSLWRARLRELRDEIRSLRGRGWVAELDCFTATNEVLVLSNDVLREMADLGVDFCLTIGLARKHSNN